jgi:heparinase II/III-like protein
MTIRARLRRVRRVSSGEVAWRARAFAQRTADRVAATLRPPAWRRASLARALAEGGELRDVRALLTTNRVQEAHHALAAHVRLRPIRFLVHPSMRAPLTRRVLAAYPAADAEARAWGTQVCAGEYHLLGYESLRFDDGGAPDWHLDPVSGRRAPVAFWADVPYLDPASCGDHKVIWEFNRHQHWIALGRAWWLTGDQEYRARALHEAESWLAANPPLLGVNWASALELGLRAISWVWAIELFAGGEGPGEEPWLVDLLLGLNMQLRHVERNLSWYFSPNTHLLGEALALYVCGCAWPELAGAERWTRLGGDILIGEGERQVLPDGMHAEGSPHYHRYALDFYLLALSLARLARDVSREMALAALADRMATALRHITDAGGRVPLIGDDDGGELFPLGDRAPDDVRPTLAWAATLLDRPELALGPTPESVLWLTAAFDAPSAAGAPSPVIERSVTLASSGYHVSRRNGAVLVFDAGPHGFMNGGHAHADALSLTMSAGPHRLLIDPGTGTYTVNPALRDRLRSSELHNTVTVDRRSQSVPAGPFHWARAAGARVERAVIGETFDLFYAVTDAYAPITHERFVLATGEASWAIADRIAGEGRHHAAVHWHIDPAWTLSPAGQGAWSLTLPSGLEARLAVCHASTDVFHGDEDSGLGWVAPVYGRLTPATTVRATVERRTPFWIVTTIHVGNPGLPAATTRLVDAGSGLDDRCAVLNTTAAHLEVAAFRVPPARDPLTCALDDRGTSGFSTDAAAVYARTTRDGRLMRVLLVDATWFRYDGAQAVTISCDGSTDVDVRLDCGSPVIACTGLRDGVHLVVERAREGGATTSPQVREPVWLE